ncbi:MAG: glycosyl transferase, partial [Clostridia bacterium]|nr:glycosyl transferase [Clostridia bacterium]
DVMVTDRGGGFSKKGGLQVTRWREDAYGGKYGFYIFLKNNKDQIWSATLDPFGQEADGYRAVFSLDRAEYFRTDDLFHTHTEIMVSPEDDVEIRRVTVTNHYAEAVTIEFSSYLEPVMAAQAADLGHPAFSKLFVQTEVLPEEESLLAMRRPRGQDEERLWAFHSMFVEGEKIGSFQYESCRGNFIGRGKDISCPQALKKPLTKTVGAVLDPAMSLRGLVRIEPGESASVTYLLGLTASREEALELIRKYRSSSSLKRAAEMALTRSQVGTHFFNFQAEEISTYQDMVSQLFFPSPLRKKYARVIAENTKGQSGLWAYGISGDLPLVLVSVSKREHVELVREAFRAHEYWRTKGLEVDLVILNEDQSKYFQPLQDLLEETVASSYHKYLLDTPGGVHLRNAQLMPSEDCRLFYTAARIILKGGEGTLKRQIQVHQEREEVSYPPLKVFPEEPCSYPAREELLPELLFFNGFGGFSRDGKEYIIQLKEGLQTPAPWINVIANKKFGFLISESGSGCIWAENSRENKLTPWSNDPVSDPPGEVVYLRDEKSGEVWTITPLPIREKEAYLIRHGAGYTSFRHVSHGLGQKLTCFVPLEDSLKISLINLKNHSDRERSLSLTYYIRPVLGVSDQLTQAYLTTEFREDKGIFLIKNLFSADFPGRLVFLASSEKITSFTGHRGEFLGAGDLKRPEALQREGLSGKTGFALDPCAALQVQLQLQPGEEKELVFLLGQGLEYGAVKRMVREYRSLPNCRDALVKVKDYWEKILGTIQVETPDLSLNLMINRWLLYQIIVCRLWGRSAFYQAGGAYGFRDQLQDALNCLYVSPEITRKQLLLHGSRQFIEGDVQHWWHPDLDERGVRTKFSDDLLWLPYVTAEYLEQTGDYQILHVLVPFLVGEPLAEDQAEKYGPAQVSTEKASLYEHCLRAIRRSLRFGRHGLPLIGSGDWNDGFSNVGTQGQGESVWLGWFLYNILMRFIPICEKMGDPVQAQAFRQAAARIVNAIEDEAWDGGWYRRAYFDDGTPLGSAANSDCMIDSLSQSWAVISGGARVDRARMAMEAVDYYLVKREEGLILLFTPPFDAGELEPGYIKGYVPGVRENGAQYTHAAAWVIKAMALLGDGDRAWELFHLVNPINHSRTPLECAVYRVEPYVAAADVYSANSQVGRGGWTWYTGAAGWLYRVALENILGLKKKGDTLLFNPCIPKSWNSYQMNYVFKQTPYRIIVRNPRGVNKGVQEVRLDGRVLPGKQVALVDDRQDHLVEVILG